MNDSAFFVALRIVEVLASSVTAISLLCIAIHEIGGGRSEQRKGDPWKW